jgi:DNA polymerase-3 subunit delta'
MPETLALELSWPLDEKTQKDLDDKKRKPSKEIRVEAARDMVAFSQQTRSGGSTKVVFVYPAERMNHVTANTILKTLEEPPGECRFVLASEAAHQLLPTIRSRCKPKACPQPMPPSCCAPLVAAPKMRWVSPMRASKLRTGQRCPKPCCAAMWAQCLTPRPHKPLPCCKSSVTTCWLCAAALNHAFFWQLICQQRAPWAHSPNGPKT